MSDVVRLSPYYYIHIQDKNKNTTRVITGPESFVKKDHEQLVKGPEKMVNIPPRFYCVVQDPAVRDEEGELVYGEHDQVKLRHGEKEVRLHKDWPKPFPLYPGESMPIQVKAQRIIVKNSAFHVRAIQDFVDEDDNKRSAGDEWLIHGPRTYLESVQREVLKTVRSRTIKTNQALMIKATVAFTDRDGVARKTGDTWLYKVLGSYLPSVNEEVQEVRTATIVTERRALRLKALHSFTDVYGKQRRAGQEWLVTHKMTTCHIQDVYEAVVSAVQLTTLTKQQYCVLLDPLGEDGMNQWGVKALRKGPMTFFLQPNEKLESGVQTVKIMGPADALLIKAINGFTEEVEEGKRIKRVPGDEWMTYGPQTYVPPVEVEIIEQRAQIPMAQNEGIYVRNKKTGKISVVRGETYMLKPEEQLYNKELPSTVEALLNKSTLYQGNRQQQRRTKSRAGHEAVTFRVPHNGAVQLYDYKTRDSRIVFGPKLVMLEPNEEFTIMSISGGIPKKANAISSLVLQLGPDFMRDVVTVETSDHAQLKLRLSYNWYFAVNRADSENSDAIFSVRDFVGDACKAIAARVRGKVASVAFDDFHKNSSDIIRAAVFGERDGVAAESLLFSANLLTITNVDIQSVEPTEQRTRDALQQSVQLAIGIATASQEALANHEAKKEEQISAGKLELQTIGDQSLAEKQRKDLILARAATASSRASGQAKAEAQAEADAALITAKMAVEQAEKKTQALKIRSSAHLAQLKLQQLLELEHRRKQDEIEIERAKRAANIEAGKFAKIIRSIGAETIEAIARAGPEMQAKLLQGLGLEGFLVTDGTSPINLFNTAKGLVGN